jgi:predicted aspartyl protease
MARRIAYMRAPIRGVRGKRVDVPLKLDSGVMYSVLPSAVWRQLGLKPKRQMTFTLADGTTVDRPVSEAHLTLPQREAHTPVILGEERDQALLGVVTLEILGLVFNPFNRTLHRMRMLLC